MNSSEKTDFLRHRSAIKTGAGDIAADIEHAREDRMASREALMTRLRSQSTTGARKWTRDELYEDCPK